MKFSVFIDTHLEAILGEWDAFAGTLLPAAQGLSTQELRNHSRDVLQAIAIDMESGQTDADRSARSRQPAGPGGASESAAACHGAVRQMGGFEVSQLVAEYRALRASVLGLWSRCDDATTGETAAREIGRFNDSVDQALGASVERYASEVAKSRNMFLAVLGHDVRGPLSSIRMAAEILVMPDLDAPTRIRVALRVRRAVEVIGRLTTDLLEYTRSRLGRGMPVDRLPTDLRRVCEDTVDAMRGTFPDRLFEQRVSGDLQISCDAGRIQQMLSNLLNNAVQYGDPSRPIVLDAEGCAQCVTVKVTSFGEPIPENCLHSVFEPLVQIPRVNVRLNGSPQSSVGLGLCIVRDIVRGHQGTVSLTSSAEGGTVFTIALPKVTP